MAFILCAAFAFTGSPAQIVETPVFNAVSGKLWGWLLMPLLFMIIEQDMGQRCFAAGSPRIVSRATFFAGLLTMAICCLPIFLGVYGKMIGVEVLAGESVMMAVITKLTNPWVAALVGCAILAAIISTADSLINAISSNLSNDFKIFKKESVRRLQILTAGISLAAIIFSFYFNNIVDLLIQSYELSVSCLFVSIFIALFWRKGNFFSALLSILFGAISFVTFKLLPAPLPKEVISVLFSLCGFLVGEVVVRTGLITQNSEKI